MPRGFSRRRLLQILGCSIAGLAVLLLAFPVWFPWVLAPLARQNGAAYSHYVRAGYSRFELKDFIYADSSAKVHAGRVRALTPISWLWRHFITGTRGEEPFVQVDDWRVEALPSTGPGTSVDETLSDLRALSAKLEQWLPDANLNRGIIESGQTQIVVPRASWHAGELQATLQIPSMPGQLTCVASLRHWPWQVFAQAPAFQSEFTFQISTNPAGVLVGGQGICWSNRVDLEAQFGRAGQLPDSAFLKALKFRLPTRLFISRDYGELSGSLSATWQGGRFGLDLEAHGAPPATQSNQPPVNLSLHAAGDTNSLVIETATISAPGLRAELSKHTLLGFTGGLLRNPAVFRLSADLARQSWLPLRGNLNGEVELYPSAGKFPRAQFRLDGAGIRHAALEAKTISLTGGLDWPRLTLTKAQANFSDGSTLSLDGGLNLETQSVEAGHLRFNGALVRQWLPPGYSCSNVEAKVEFDGPANDLHHRGNVHASRVTLPALQPLDIAGRWEGQQTNLQHFEVQAAAPNTELLADGSLTCGSAQCELQLQSLVLRTNHQIALKLTQPSWVSVAHRPDQKDWDVRLASLDLAGPDGDLNARASVAWPSRGSVQLQGYRLSSAILSGLLQTNLIDVEVSRVNVSAAWSNSPVALTLDLDARAHAPKAWTLQSASTPPNAKAGQAAPRDDLEFEAKLQVFTAQNALVLSNLTVFSRTAAVFTAHGSLPLTLHPDKGASWLEFFPDQPLQFITTTEPRSILWQKIGDWTGLSLNQPDLEASLSGTWKSPRGTVRFGARQIKYEKTSRKLPDLQELRVTVRFDRETAELTEGRLFVQGEPVLFAAKVPLGESFWQGWRQQHYPDWQKGTARLWIEDAELAPFEPFFPSVLAPQGRLKLDVSWLPGERLQGELRLQHGRTRPIGNLGAVRDINVRMRIQNRALALDEVSARIGSSPLTITGQADLSGSAWLKGELPPFQVSIVGRDVPLARQPEFIIRSDLALLIARTNGAPPMISGAAHLRDSYYLSDLRALVPGQVAAPAKRPPYFSIEDPALADWRLALDVDGARFLKVRSTLFNGETSTSMKLQGTLKDPIALGDVKIDSGVVRFPFASLAVQQGLVTLSSQDPYHPQMSVKAASKQFGYDLRMEVSGAVDNPVIQFNSTPPLSSEQIVLMVTAGQMPQGTFSLTPQQRAQTVAMFLGRDLLAKLGFADQADQRLTIHSGEEISEQGRPTYHVEYKLTEGWSLVGEYDRFGDFNAGVKWRIYSK